MDEQLIKKTTERDTNYYIVGFVLSLALIALPYMLVTQKILSDGWLIASIISCAVVQLVVQLVCFLKLGRSKNGQWNLLVFLFMLMVVFIVVIGSLWIMDNLNYNMMPHEMNEYMLKESNKGF